MKDLLFGVYDPEVSNIKKKLIKLGYDISNTDDSFGIETHIAVKAFQEARGLDADGWVGDKTSAALDKASPSDVLPEKPQQPVVIVNPTPVTDAEWYAALWVGEMAKRLGWTEFDHNKEIAKDWPKTGLDYDSVIGTNNAWCGLAAFMALYNVGLAGPKKSYGASSWEGWAESCGYVFGAFLPIRHSGGGRHITIFLYWVDEAKKLAACMGGNQNNAYRISVYNLSGNKAGHDEVMSGPRCPVGYKDKLRKVSQAEAQKLFKSAGIDIGGSTT